MTEASRPGGVLHADLLHLWAAGWLIWLATGVAAPLPPWRAGEILEREESRARQLASEPTHVSAWAANLGDGRQHGVLTRGWTPNLFTPVRVGKTSGGRVFAIGGPGPLKVAFRSPGWEETRLLLWIRSSAGSDVTVGVALDGREAGSVVAKDSWDPVSLDVGRLGGGLHELTLETPSELQLDGLVVARADRARALATASFPPGDCGYAGWLRIGLDARPTLFVCGETPVIAGARLETLDGGRVQALYAFDAGRGSGPVRTPLAAANGLVGCAMALVVTGLGWTRRRRLSGLTVALAASTLIVVLSFLALRAIGVPPGPLPFAACLAAAGAVGLLRQTREGRRVRLPWQALGLGLVVLVLLAVLTFFSVRVVPPLDDLDLEVQATASSLARWQIPLTVTDRGTTYYFAHPPLLHVWVSASFTLTGRLERVADAPELAAEAQLEGPTGKRDGYPPPYLEYWEQLLNRFYNEPQRWPTRQVNVLLGALAAAALVHLVDVTFGSRLLGLACGLLLATLPEFLLRSSYGGYFASTTLISLLVLAGPERRSDPPLAGFLAGLSNQKGLLVPLAWALAGPRGEGWRRLVPLAGGLTGIAVFVAWGLGVDAPTFIFDFVKLHVTERFALDDLRFVHDQAAWYPSIPELWRKFAENYGLLFTVAAAAASLRGVVLGKTRARVAGAAVLIGAMAFSLTDWRQTRHLALLAAPAILAMADAVPRQGNGRRVAFALLVLMIARNVWLSLHLAVDFHTLTPLTIW